MQDEGIEGMEDEGAYRAVLYTCVAAHWVTLLTAVAVAGTAPITPLALLGARARMHACTRHTGSSNGLRMPPAPVLVPTLARPTAVRRQANAPWIFCSGCGLEMHRPCAEGRSAVMGLGQRRAIRS